MIKSEAMAKVLDLLSLAEGETTLGEAASAFEQAIKLRLKYGISDGELETAKAARYLVNHGQEHLSKKWFFYSRAIQPHLTNIEMEMQAVLDEIDRLDIGDRMQRYCQFLQEMRSRIEAKAANSQYGFRALALRRDDVVREYYQAELEAYRARGFTDEVMAHQHARSYASMHSDLSKATVERIVGVSEKDLMDKAWRQLQAENAEVHDG